MEPRTAPSRTAASVRAGALWYLILAAHALLAGGWWLLMPRGFPATHSRFWSNGIFPIALLAVTVVIGVMGRGERVIVRRVALFALAAGWGAAMLATLIMYPRSALRAAPAPGLVILVIMTAAFTSSLRRIPVPRRLLALMLPAGVIGVLMTLAQRAPLPQTRPLDDPVPAIVSGTSDSPVDPRLSPSVIFSADPPAVALRNNRIDITAEPMLTFVSRSPDRFWTVFARQRDREGVPRTLAAWETIPRGMRLGYSGGSTSALSISCPSGDVAEITAHTHLPRPVYSHLNYFCRVSVVGHQRLFLEFSPCPGHLVEVTPSDYPFGRPSRFAYLDGRGQFNIVQATSGEKGPFHTLAVGRLSRSEALVVTIHDQNQAIAKLRLDDFAAQASTQLSPTAGYGVPANAVEFFLMGDRPSSPVMLYFTLASTSVGRGYDSVGHAAGTYRNRMRIELIAPALVPSPAHR